VIRQVDDDESRRKPHDIFSANLEPREPSKLGWLRPMASGRIKGGGITFGAGTVLGGVEVVENPGDLTGTRFGPGLITATSFSNALESGYAPNSPDTGCDLRGDIGGDIGGDPGPTNIDDGSEPGPP
jgi:hypothetical protein